MSATLYGRVLVKDVGFHAPHFPQQSLGRVERVDGRVATIVRHRYGADVVVRVVGRDLALLGLCSDN